MSAVTYVISDVNKAHSFEWIAKSFRGSTHNLSFILLNKENSAFEQFLIDEKFPVRRLQNRGKHDWIPLIFRLYIIFKKTQPDIVHCHMINANILGLTSAWLSGVKSRIYTRHHSSFHHVYFPKGVWWDKWANRLSTDIIAISPTVKDILLNWEKVDDRKLSLIPHGFDLNHFMQTGPIKSQDWLKSRQINSSPVIGVISRFTELKGIQYIIPAFSKFLKRHPDARLVLLNARGDYKRQITEQLQALPPDSYQCIEFEEDIVSAYLAMDMFVHVPIDSHSEAFGQVYVEALAAGVPSIFTLSGIATDFIQHKYNAWVVPFQSSDAIYDALIELWENIDLRQALSKNGSDDVRERFQLAGMIQSLQTLYDRCQSR